MLQLLIHNARIIDGTGSPWFRGSVLVDQNTLTVKRGELNLVDYESERVIDAEDNIVCPGFVDLHSHAGLTILGDPHHDPKVRQGVTTELVGIDGISHAPFKTREELERYIWLDAGLNWYPPEPDWLTTQQLLNKYDGSVAINIAYILGNSPVRIWASGWEDRPATESEIANMKSVIRESMEEGAWGLSTGLDYPPGAFASTEELIAISTQTAKMGGIYHTHTRASLKSQGVYAPWEEAVEIGRKSGIPIHLTHYRQPKQGEGTYQGYLGLVEDARDEGIDVTFDCYAYPYSGTAVTIMLPFWAKDGGPERTMAALSDPYDRNRMKRELNSRSDIQEIWNERWLHNFREPHNSKYDGKSIWDIAEMRAQEPADALFDLLLEERLGISEVGTGTNADTLPEFVSHPFGMIASDAILFGEYPNPRTYGCFPVVLSKFVRTEKHLKLPEAIRKMTSFPAQRIGLMDRGQLADGFRADIVIFNPDTVHTDATKQDPKHYPVGIDYVIVNGEFVIEKGKNTGATPGKALRRGH